MANKINQIYFRTGIKNDWNSKYIEKKDTEFKFYSLKTEEIISFIKQKFIKAGFKIFFLRLFFSKRSLHIFFIYDYITNVYLTFKNKSNFVLKKKKNFKSSKFFINFMNIFQVFKMKKYIKKKFFKKNSKIVLRTNFLLNKGKSYQRFNLLKFLSFLKLKNKTITNFTVINNFINNFVYSLNIYLRNKTSIFLTIKKIIKNNYTRTLNRANKKEIVSLIPKLRKFEKIKAFESIISSVFKSSDLNNKAFIISKLFSFFVRKIKKPKLFNYFLRFLKNTLTYFLVDSKLVKVLRINLKGNLGKINKAKKRSIKIGGLSVNRVTLNSNLDYSMSTCYNKKGAFGLKVYIL